MCENLKYIIKLKVLKNRQIEGIRIFLNFTRLYRERKVREIQNGVNKNAQYLNSNLFFALEYKKSLTNLFSIFVLIDISLLI